MCCQLLTFNSQTLCLICIFSFLYRIQTVWRSASLGRKPARVSEERAGILLQQVQAACLKAFSVSSHRVAECACFSIFISNRENLSKDLYLISQMDSDQFVPIWTIASMEGIKVLTTDMDLILDVLRCKYCWTTVKFKKGAHHSLGIRLLAITDNTLLWQISWAVK